jgi:hypothetical protein
MKTYISRFLLIVTGFLLNPLVFLHAIESDSLIIDPDNPLVIEVVQVQSYVTIPNCCTEIDSVQIHTNLVELSWTQTQCSDPWNTGSGHPNDQTYDSLVSYFSQLGIDLYHVGFMFYPDSAETCEACDCKTGTVIYIYVEDNDTPLITEMGFIPSDNMYFDLVRTYHQEHYPACDCYCQCADTVNIGTLEAGSHRLIFNTVFIDTLIQALYQSYDSLDFSVTNIVTSPDNTFKDDEILIYPNPSSGILHISKNLLGEHYDLFDLSGRKIMSGTIENTLINNLDLLPGTYLFKIYLRDNNTVVRKLIINP